MGLQHLGVERIDALIIRRYQIMYGAFFKERALIPDGRFCELPFEALEKDPVGQVQRIYDHLDLPGFEAMRPALERYVDSTLDYRKNTYPDLPSAVRGEIARAWRRNFEWWGYAS
jgi:hypothetical protein